MTAFDVVPADERSVVVVGGGVIGLACAVELSRAGHGVTVVDAAAARGASWVAAGMLAPVSEAVFGEDALTRLTMAAVPALVRLAEHLDADGGEPVGLRREGTVAVALTADDRAALERLSDYRDSLGLSTRRLGRAEVRRLEPYLAGEVRGGVLAADDLSIDNRRYLHALQRVAAAAGVTFVRDGVRALLTAGATPIDPGALGAPVAGVLLESGRALSTAEVVLSTGARTDRLARVGVQPVKGQIVRLRVPPRLRQAGPVLQHTVRGIVRGSEVYLVPRADGEVVVGATQEQQGFDVTVTAGGLYELLRNAYELLPITAEFDFVEALAGSRPGTADNAPIVGRLANGLVIATGHYRNGILLSALTAETVTRVIGGRGRAEEWEPFAVDRFIP